MGLTLISLVQTKIFSTRIGLCLFEQRFVFALLFLGLSAHFKCIVITSNSLSHYAFQTIEWRVIFQKVCDGKRQVKK